MSFSPPRERACQDQKRVCTRRARAGESVILAWRGLRWPRGAFLTAAAALPSPFFTGRGWGSGAPRDGLPASKGDVAAAAPPLTPARAGRGMPIPNLRVRGNGMCHTCHALSMSRAKSAPALARGRGPR